jgi:hypothetical protein
MANDFPFKLSLLFSYTYSLCPEYKSLESSPFFLEYNSFSLLNAALSSQYISIPISLLVYDLYCGTEGALHIAICKNSVASYKNDTNTRSF